MYIPQTGELSHAPQVPLASLERTFPYIVIQRFLKWLDSARLLDVRFWGLSGKPDK